MESRRLLLTQINTLIQTAGANKYTSYADDPVGFGREVLGNNFTDDVVKLMESVRDNEITIAMSCNASGKSHAAARVAVWVYVVFADSKVYLAAAPPQDNLKDILWGEIGAIVSAHPGLFANDNITNLLIAPKRDFKSTAEGEEEPPHLIRGLSVPSSGTPKERESKFSGKHSGHIVFIFDEGDAIPDPCYAGAESCMSGGWARMLILVNPRQMSGEVYRMIRDRRANVVHLSAFAHPNVVTGEDKIPGAVTRATTIRRIHQWTRPAQPDEVKGDFFDVPEYLVGTTCKSPSGEMYPPLQAGRRRVENSAFCYMVLGRYPSEGSNQLIARDWIDAARSRYDAYVAQHGEIPPAGTRPKMGLDVAEYGDDYNVATLRYGGWVAPFETWNGVDRTITSQRAATLYKERRATKAFVDASGIGKWIAPNMDGCNAQSVFVGEAPTVDVEEGQFKSMRCQLWWMVREWLRTDPGAMLPPDEMLIEELLNPTYYWNTRGKIEVKDKDTMKEELKRSPDRADSLALTFAPDESVIDGLDVESCGV